MSDSHFSQQPPAPLPDSEATGVYNPVESASGLVRVLDQYLADLQAGKAPDKARLMAEHPDLARQLEDCLAGIEFVHRTAHAPAATPTQLGDFRIIREIGRGGMGVVYEAEQRSLKRRVALKVLRFGMTADPELMQRFQREAETVAHLHHTNIVPIHAVGCEQGVHYYAMQFIEGRSLAAVAEELQQNRSAQPASLEQYHEIARWILQAAEALTHAHQRGVIHRDIKPSNLILDPEGTVWLTDFGLAKRADEVTLTAAGILMGTPRYMSPEQAAATQQPIDHRTDIYSLGATLYELATGKPVFDSQTPQGVITQILNSEPVAPRLLQGTLPRDLETIILKCLSKEPARRYQAARDLADDLRAFLENRPIRARRASLVERAVRWSRKHRRSTVVSAVTAIASLLLIVAAISLWTSYQESLNGRLILTTDGQSLVAEVLDDHDDLVIPSFPVPTSQPVTLRAGSYRVRLSSSGQLSETWQIDVERGRQNSYPVKLLDRLLAPPLEVLSRDPPALIELNGQTHLLVGGERGWRIMNGATWQSLWPGDLKLPDTPLAPTNPQTIVNLEEWRNLLEGFSEAGGYHSPSTGQSPGLARPGVDIDGDGRQDLIFASRVSPSLLAVSSKEGRPLWWFRAAPLLPAEHDLSADPIDQMSSGETAGVIGHPTVVEIDGQPIIVAALMSTSGSIRTKGGKVFAKGTTCTIEAVAARTGKLVWSTPLNVPDLPQIYSEAIKLFSAHPEVVRLGGRSAIVLMANTTLFAFDPATGRAMWTLPAGARPVQPPQFADIDGDGETDVLLLRRKAKDSDDLELRAIALADRRTLWERTFLRPGYLNHNNRQTPGTEVTSVADLDGDGRPEIMNPVRDDWTKHGRHWLGVEVLDGATGTVRWQQRLQFMAFSSSGGSGGGMPLRQLVGPDLDGDQHRELFVASFGSTPRYPEVDGHYLQVDALSGSDGRVLWRWRHNVSSNLNPLARQDALHWWQVDKDGWPQLVVPATGAGGQPITFILAASNGRLMHVLPEVADPQIADINSDGIPDLCSLSGPQERRRLTVLKGLPPVDWRRPGKWFAAGDYDGDGIPDFREWRSDEFSRSRLAALSGANGRILWQEEIRPDTNAVEQQRTVDVDVNGDGTPDVVLLEQFSAPGGQSNTVTAISGRDGHRIWSAPDFGLQTGSTSSSGGGPQRDYSYPLLDQHDLDGDGRPEILVAAHIGDPNGITLVALSSHDGQLLWKIPIVPGGYTGTSLIDRHLWHDLNGDRVLDIALWVPKTINENGVGIGAELRAFSGRDGKRLWEQAAPTSFEWPWWPRTAIADLDSDGRAEVVATSHDYQGQNELLVLDGHDGKRKWNWSGSLGGNDTFWPPLLIDAGGDGRRIICLGVREQTPTGAAHNIVVFDPKGEVRGRIPIGWLGPATAWTALDVDADGQEELLFIKDAQLHAYRLTDQSDVWTHPIASYGFSLTEFRPSLKDQPGTLVAWSDRMALGLNVATGAALWRCDVPRPDKYQLIASLAFRHDRQEPPRVVSHSAQYPITMLQQAWPATGAGAYLAPISEPLKFVDHRDPIRYRPLPWAGRLRPVPAGPIADPPLKRLFGLSEWPLILVVIGTFGYWMARGRWRTAGLYFLVYLLTTVVNGGLMLAIVGSRFEADEAFSWDGWYWVLYVGAIAMGFFTVAGSAVAIPVRILWRRVGGTRKVTLKS